MSLLAIPSGTSSNVSGGFYPLEIEGSLRFNDDDSAYLSRTATAGESKIWTLSFWMKPTGASVGQVIFGAGPNASNLTRIDYRADKRFQIFNSASGVANGSLVFDPYKFRDPSAWYHFVFVVNTPASETDRYQFYVNGERLTGTSSTPGENTYPSVNATTQVNTAVSHEIGRRIVNNSEYLDAYLAEVHFTDGTAYDADDFGELKSGVWVAKEPSVTYGTNGFHLEFAGNANDSSGNGNNWTANSISSYDYVPDSPTNNFATLNPLGTNDISSFSQGNLQITTGSGASTSGVTMGMSSGKWYAEFVCTAKTSVNFGIGLIKANTFDGDNQLDEGTNVGYFWVNNANVYHGFASDSYGTTFSTGDVMGVAFDADTLALQFYINGSGQGNYTRVASENTAGDHWIFGCGEGQGGATATFVANFGQDSSFVGNKTAQGNTDDNGFGDFYYSPPSGYLALCTANLTVAEGVDPANDNSPQDYFNPVLYTGNSGSQTVTGVGFSAELVWAKNMVTTGYHHEIYDKVRGDNKRIFPSQTDQELTGYLQFGAADGFSLTNGGGINNSPDQHVAWCWLINGTGSANGEGSITTTSTSANTTSGVSVIKWTGDGTIGHGLDEIPEMFMVKDLTAASSWWVWHKDYDNTSAGYMQLNDGGNAERSNTLVWRNAYPATATTIDVNTTYINYSTDDYLALCFHSVEGFSSFGKYIGNGGAGGTSGYDGPFVYTGFRPSFVLVRNIDNGWNWIVWDSKRDPYNQVNGALEPNNSNNEYDVAGYMSADFLSNGFKIRSNDAQENGNGQTHIYMAFAENPFKYANAR